MTNDDLDGLSDSIKKLRVTYEKYFMGIERMEPLKERDVVKKTLRRLQTEQTTNTGLRFRLQSLQATLITYEQHWNRIARQIEEGTFKRDKLRAQQMLEKDQPEERAPAAEGDAVPELPAAHPPSARAEPSHSKAAAEPQYSESIRKLHEAFENTRKQLGGSSQPVPISALAATVQKQVAALKQQYNCKTVEFKVVVKDGKPILKAFPK